MEYVKFGCAINICKFCVSWNGKPAERISQPVPDPDRPYHYMHVSVTPKISAKGTPRDADDWYYVLQNELERKPHASSLYNNCSLSFSNHIHIW